MSPIAWYFLRPLLKLGSDAEVWRKRNRSNEKKPVRPVIPAG